MAIINRNQERVKIPPPGDQYYEDDEYSDGEFM